MNHFEMYALLAFSEFTVLAFSEFTVSTTIALFITPKGRHYPFIPPRALSPHSLVSLLLWSVCGGHARFQMSWELSG